MPTFASQRETSMSPSPASSLLIGCAAGFSGDRTDAAGPVVDTLIARLAGAPAGRRAFLIFETLVHHIDTARFLFGGIESVMATTSRRNPVIRGEDAAILVIRHDSGVTGVIDGNRYLNPYPPGPAMGSCCIEGEAGRLQINAIGSISLGPEVVWRAPPELGYKGDSVYATQAHFLECLLKGSDFETSVREYLHTFAAVEAAYESADGGTRVRPAELLARAEATT